MPPTRRTKLKSYNITLLQNSWQLMIILYNLSKRATGLTQSHLCCLIENSTLKEPVKGFLNAHNQSPVQTVFQLEPGSQKEILGLAVGANPLGQLLFSPLLGYWANRAGSARAPLLATLVLFVLASMLYSQLHLTRPHAKYWMVLARFLVGVSSGTSM